jgi:hypothetical protein
VVIQEDILEKRLFKREDLIKHIPMNKCKDKHLYIIDTEGADLGIYDSKNHGFKISYFKLGVYHIGTEFHWDADPPFGTVKPIAKLEFVGDKTDEDLIHFFNNRMISLMYEIKEIKKAISIPIVLIDTERMRVLKSFESKFKFFAV